MILESADADVLDRYSDARREIFLNRVSPQAVRNKQFVFHANGGGAALEEGVAGIRRMASDDDFRLERLMFNKSLETPLLLGEPVS